MQPHSNWMHRPCKSTKPLPHLVYPYPVSLRIKYLQCFAKTFQMICMVLNSGLHLASIPYEDLHISWESPLKYISAHVIQVFMGLFSNSESSFTVRPECFEMQDFMQNTAAFWQQHLDSCSRPVIRLSHPQRLYSGMQSYIVNR